MLSPALYWKAITISDIRHTSVHPVKSITQRFSLGFITIHILYHAAREPVYGLWLMEELKRHGYAISPGTLYPIVHGLEAEGLLKSSVRTVDGKVRRYYRATAQGRGVLKDAIRKIEELVEEVLERSADIS